MKMKIVLMIFIILFSALLSSCQKENSNNVGYIADVIRINDTGQFASCIQRIIRLKSMLESYLPDNISVEWTNITGGDAQRDALVANRLDITAMSIIQLLSATENGLPLALLSSAASQSVYLYSNNEEVKSFADITDSTRIAVTSRATNMELAFFIKSAEVFGDPLIYYNNIVTVPTTEMLASLSSSKDLDCAIIVLPNNILADEIEDLTMIEDLTPIIMKNSLASLFVTNNDFLRSNPVLVDAFKKATEDAVRFINEEPMEAATLLANDYGIEANYLVDAFNKYPIKLEINEAGFDKTAELLTEIEVLTKTAVKLSEFPNYSDIPKE